MSPAHEDRRISNLVFYGAVLLIGFLAYRIVQPFLAEIGWAVVLAICLAPVQSRLAPRLGSARSAALLTTLVVLLLIVPAVFAALALVREGSEIVGYVEGQVRDRGGPLGFLDFAWGFLQQRLPFLPSAEEIVERISSSLGGVAGLAASRAGSLVKGALSFVFSTAITLGILFFLLKDAPAMARATERVLPFGSEQNARLLSLTRDIVWASVSSMLVIALIQGVLGGLTFWLVGVKGAALWGSLMAALSMLPAVGAALVWAPAAIWLALSGSVAQGIVLALVGVLVLGNVDNVIRPLLLSGSARMGTLVLVISLLGGVSAFGFIGIVLGPVVAAVLTALVESYALVPEPQPELASAPIAPPPAPDAAAPGDAGDAGDAGDVPRADVPGAPPPAGRPPSA